MEVFLRSTIAIRVPTISQEITTDVSKGKHKRTFVSTETQLEKVDRNTCPKQKKLPNGVDRNEPLFLSYQPKRL